MESNLRDKTIKGSFWAIIERFGYLTLQFVSTIVLARLLLPEDFGAIGILLVFVTISEVLVDGGFSTALIQHKKIVDIDISTVFFTNLLIAFCIYFLIFISSTWIASFFNNPNLSLLLRVIELRIIIDAIGAVQFALLRREMDFKSITIIRILSIFVAVSIAIVCAIFNCGVWSLVAQHLSFSVLCVIMAWVYSPWRPKLEFSKASISKLFGYGSKLMIQQLLSEVYENIQSVLIGRHFLASDLGFYSQAKQLQQVPVKTLTNVVTTVSFPAFSKLQNDKESLKRMVKKNLSILLFINTPLMCYLAILAEPIISLLYSDKWLPSVPYFQFLCLGFGIFLIIHQCNLTVLKSVGRSDYVLYLEIIKKILGFVLLFMGMKLWGIFGILYGLGLNSLIEIFLNGYCVKKEIDYGIYEQLKDLFIPLGMSVFPSISIYLIIHAGFFNSNLIIVLVCTVTFWCLYYLLAKLFKSASLSEIECIVSDYLFHERNKTQN